MGSVSTFSDSLSGEIRIGAKGADALVVNSLESDQLLVSAS